MEGVYKIFATTWGALLIRESKTKNYLTYKVKVKNLKSFHRTLKKNGLGESIYHHKPPKP